MGKVIQAAGGRFHILDFAALSAKSFASAASAPASASASNKAIESATGLVAVMRAHLLTLTPFCLVAPQLDDRT